jgi:hypothetical protein
VLGTLHRFLIILFLFIRNILHSYEYVAPSRVRVSLVSCNRRRKRIHVKYKHKC